MASLQELEGVLKERYGIGDVERIVPLAAGSADCFRVYTSDTQFLLKQFPPKYTLEDVRVEPALTRFLRSRRFPAARFVQTLTKDDVWEHGGRVFHLQEFVEGAVYAQNKAPDWLLWESAVLLGRLHALLEHFPLDKVGFLPEWFEWDAGAKKRQYAVLMEAVKQAPASELHERIVSDLQYKVSLVDKAAGIAIDRDKLTWRKSHGDYHVSQMVCGPDRVRAVIDFSSACALPALWELLRSYTLADPSCADAAIDAARLKNYAALYMASGGRLTPYDLASAPRLYFVQLVRSLYGYHEYLAGRGFQPGASHKLAPLLNFAFWRTDMCRWLEQNAHALSAELADLAS